MRIEPEKSNQRPDDGEAEDRELARIGEIEHPEVLTRVDAAHDVAEDREGTERDRPETGAEAIKTVGDVHRVAGTGENERREDDVEPRESRGRNDNHVFEKGHRRRRAREVWHEGMLPQIPPKPDTDDHLTGELIALHEPAVLLPLSLLFWLEIVVPQSDGAHPEHNEQCDEHVRAP